MEEENLKKMDEERSLLLKISLSTGFMSIIFFYLFEKIAVANVLASVCLLFLIICLCGRIVSHNSYLIVDMISGAIGKMISQIILVCIYILGIGCLGSFLKLFKMNMLLRNWKENLNKNSMFCKASEISKESFWRQS